jgi:arsenate reductase (glutaredoxin)
MSVTTVTVYGIANCDTVKKARNWLEAHGVAHTFHDYKKSGVDAAKLASWCETEGWETILNRAGTTFRKLSDTDKAGLTSDKAIALMIAHPSLIKRPIVDIKVGRQGGHQNGRLVGFHPTTWAAALAPT